MMDKGHRQAFEAQFPKPEGVVWSGSDYAAATDSPECAAAASQHRLVYRAWLCGGDWAFDEAAGAVGRLADSHAAGAGEARPDPGCDYQTAWDDAANLIRALRFHAASGTAEPPAEPDSGVIESEIPITSIGKARLALRQLEEAAGSKLGDARALACAEAVRAEIPAMNWVCLSHGDQRIRELEKQANRFLQKEAKRAELFRSWWDSTAEQAFDQWIGDEKTTLNNTMDAAYKAWKHLHEEVIFDLQNRIKHLEHINGCLNQDLRSKAQQAASTLERIADHLESQAVPGGTDDALERSYCINTLRLEVERLCAVGESVVEAAPTPPKHGDSQ